MNKLSAFLEGVLSVFIIPTHASLSDYHTRYANTDVLQVNDSSQDWQAVGKDISIAANKVGNSIDMVRYEPKTT